MQNNKPYVRKWQKINTKGSPYSPRTGHTVVAFENSVYIFGGTDSEKRQNDLHRLNLDTETWSNMNSTSNRNDYQVLPLKRSGAKGVVYNRKFYIFGGYDGRGGNYFNDIYCFDFKKCIWQEILPNKNKRGNSFLPHPRTDHSVCLHNDCLIIFAGYDGYRRLSDLHRFSLKYNTWKRIPIARTNKEAPCHRFAHSSVVYKDEMYVFGGWNGQLTLNSMWKFNFNKREWTCICIGNERQKKCPENWPDHRYRHTAIVHGDEMFVFGGVNKHHQRFNDVQSYNFKTETWRTVKVCGNSPASRTFHPALTIESFMYVFGGYDGKSRLNDVHKLYVGPTAIMPLQILAAEYVRTNQKRLKIYPSDLPELLSYGLLWNKDSQNVIRGPLNKTLLTTKQIPCTLFTPQTCITSNKQVILDEPCTMCGHDAGDHEKVVDRISGLSNFRQFFKSRLNIRNNVTRISPCKTLPKIALKSLTASELNKRRTIVTRSMAKQVSKQKNISLCPSPTLNEPEAKTKNTQLLSQTKRSRIKKQKISE